jgi:hypothetical protein
VVICSELPNYNGSSATYSAHRIAAEVIRYHKLSKPAWVEHYLKEATDSTSETFELVVFASYQIRERASYLGETRLTVGVSTRKPLDRETAEALVGQEV